MKADLAIYSQAVDVRGRCMSESLKLGNNLNFNSFIYFIYLLKLYSVQNKQ